MKFSTTLPGHDQAHRHLVTNYLERECSAFGRQFPEKRPESGGGLGGHLRGGSYVSFRILSICKLL